MPTITLADQVAAVIREVGMRKAVYPGRVSIGKMKQDKAEHEVAAMEAVLVTVRDYDAMRPKVLALSAAVDALAEKLGVSEADKDALLERAEKDAVVALAFAADVKAKVAGAIGGAVDWPFHRGPRP